MTVVYFGIIWAPGFFRGETAYKPSRPSYAGLACVHSSLAMRTERTRDDADASQVEAWTLLALTLRGSIASGKEGPAGRRQQRRAILYCSPPNYRGAAAARCMPAHAPPLCSPAIPPRSGPPSLPRVGLPGQALLVPPFQVQGWPPTGKTKTALKGLSPFAKDSPDRPRHLGWLNRSSEAGTGDEDDKITEKRWHRSCSPSRGGGVNPRVQRLRPPSRAPNLALLHRQWPPLAAPPLQNGRTSSSRGDAPS